MCLLTVKRTLDLFSEEGGEGEGGGGGSVCVFDVMMQVWAIVW